MMQGRRWWLPRGRAAEVEAAGGALTVRRQWGRRIG